MEGVGVLGAVADGEGLGVDEGDTTADSFGESGGF